MCSGYAPDAGFLYPDAKLTGFVSGGAYDDGVDQYGGVGLSVWYAPYPLLSPDLVMAHIIPNIHRVIPLYGTSSGEGLGSMSECCRYYSTESGLQSLSAGVSLPSGIKLGQSGIMAYVGIDITESLDLSGQPGWGRWQEMGAMLHVYPDPNPATVPEPTSASFAAIGLMVVGWRLSKKYRRL
jgi:hypothetical protein